ncbi:MAG: type II toxin-antitoxin system HipA family toxin YjjJ [Pseudomonadota bacterium]|nr:type II toxin-antitoxin system HipA family toxin YjjJ [Pseudomonadota bacterium]
MADSRLPQLETLLRRNGPLTALALGRSLGVSQPTISRLLGQAGEGIVRIGQARATRYALGREIARAGRRWPLYRVASDGRAEALGELRAVHGGGFHFQPVRPLPAFMHAPFADGLFPGLPWFLDDQRPQGFLGRAFVHRVAMDIGAPEDLARWGADDIVLALLRHGDDAPGDLVLGDAALQRALRSALSPTAMPAADRSRRYPELADAALLGEDVGSSAGGEQPKFAACLRDASGYRAVIVKFSERAGTPAAQRWADLLQCEHIVGDVLRANGIPAAESELLQADGRVFLQSTRFDRSTALGRRGLVSLAALDSAYYGHGRIDWWRFAPQLLRDGWLGADDARILSIRGWFGALIGNSDMHLGNASLALTDARPLALAPSYDMLPMALRPASTGEIVERMLDIPLPVPEQQAHWQAAAGAARDFWRRVSAGENLSAGFRDIAAAQLEKLDAAISRFG